MRPMNDRPAAAEVDLFDLGAPDSAPAPAPAAANDGFDAFQTAGPTSDAFGGADPFAASPAPAAPVVAPAPVGAPAQTFDAFGNGSAQPQQGNINAVSDAFGNMNMGGGQPQVNGTAAGEDDDDFGDFGGAAASSFGMPTAAAVAETKAKDPLSGLINLDGLQKNVQKTNNLNKPVVSGDTASQYMQYQQQMAAQGNAQNVGAQVSFNGIDGLNKMPTDFSPKGIRQNNRQHGQPIMAADQQGMNGMAANAGPGQDGGVSTGGSDAISSMFAPAPQGQQNMQQQGGQMMMGGGGNQQGGMMNQGQMNMGMQQGMQGGMNMQQQGMYNQQMGMQGQGQQMGGGMGMNGNMMMNQGMPMQGQGQQMGSQMMNQGMGQMNQMGGMGMGSQFQ